MKSIRRHQIIVLFAGTSVIMVAAALTQYAVQRRSITSDFDATLATKAGSLGALLEYEPPEIEFDFVAGTMPEYDAGAACDYFQVWIDGETIGRSPSLAADVDLAGRAGPSDRPEYFDVTLPDGRRGRAVGVELEVPLSDELPPGAVVEPPSAVIVVARSREELVRTLAFLGGLVVVEGVLIFGCIALLVVVTIRRAFVPIRRMARDVDAIDSGSLDHRLDEAGLPEELRPIAAGLNRLLGRLQEGFERERRTSANIAHELRTPVAELRTATGVALRWQDDEDLARRTVVTAGEIAVQMEATVNALLQISRIESGQTSARPTRIDLSAFVLEVLESLRPRAAARGLDLRTEVPPAMTVHTDPGGLDLLLGNLLSNAVAHTPENGWIRCRVERTAQGVRLEISNPSGALAPEDVARLTEPFWTKDAARSASSHVGLGITLAGAVARAAGIDLSFSIEDGTFRASLVMAPGDMNALNALNGSSDDLQDAVHPAQVGHPPQRR